MHGFLAVLGHDPDAQLEAALAAHPLTQGEELGGGLLRLREGATGARGIDAIAEALEDPSLELPDFLKDAYRAKVKRLRVPDRWDQARRADIVNLEEVGPRLAAVIKAGEWILPGPPQAGIPDEVTPAWLARATSLLVEGPDDELISIYDFKV